MSDLELARAGLAAWRRGDFEALEELLAPEATWRAVEPGEWDCESRDDILRTLRERYEEGFTKGPIELVEGGPGTVILLSRPAEVGGPDWPEETAIDDHVPRWQGGGHAGPSDPGRRAAGRSDQGSEASSDPGDHGEKGAGMPHVAQVEWPAGTPTGRDFLE